jgi:hypothetical protein
MKTNPRSQRPTVTFSASPPGLRIPTSGRRGDLWHGQTPARLAALTALLPALCLPALAQEEAWERNPNRVTAGALFLFNAKIGYRALSSGAPGVNPGPATGSGLRVYDDGFVGVDSTGNNAPPGATSFWGYNSAAQHVDSASDPFVGNDSIALTATTVQATGGYAPGGTLDPEPGFEIGYARAVGGGERWHWGAEVLFGFVNLDSGSGAPGLVGVTSLTDLYSLNVNGVLVAPPTAPYSGPQVAQPGSPLLNATPQRQPLTSTAGTVSGSRSFDANLFTLRLGGFYEHALTTNFNVGLNAGLAVVLVDGDFRFNETVSFTGPGGPGTLVQSGASSELDTVFGGYIGVRASYDLNERWRVFGTANYLGTSRASQSAGGARSVTLDFDQTFLLTLGVGCSF